MPKKRAKRPVGDPRLLYGTVSVPSARASAIATAGEYMYNRPAPHATFTGCL